MASVRKYMFDRSFDYRVLGRLPAKASLAEVDEGTEEAGPVEEAALAPEMVDTPKITFGEHETLIASAQEEAFGEGERKGREAGEQAARESIDQQLAAHLEEIAGQLRILAEQEQNVLGRVSEDSVQLALAVVRKLFPVLSRHHGLGEVEDVVRDCMKRMKTVPRLSVRVHERLAKALAQRLNDPARETGFDGRLDIRGDPAFSDTDLQEMVCHIRWEDGAMEHDRGRLLALIEEVIERALPGSGDEASSGESSGNETSGSKTGNTEKPENTENIDAQNQQPEEETIAESFQEPGAMK